MSLTIHKLQAIATDLQKVGDRVEHARRKLFLVVDHIQYRALRDEIPMELAEALVGQVQEAMDLLDMPVDIG